MLQKIMEVSTGVYILWGLGVLGVLMKILANAYMSKMVRASTNLGETKRKKLRNMCRQYENKKGFGLCGGDEEAYAESFVRGLKFLTRPMEFWNRSGTVLSLVVCGTMAGAYLYYDPSWRGSPDMQFFLANSILVCACLLVLDHILVINNKVEILKANIRGYLERIPKPREQTAGCGTSLCSEAGDVGGERETCRQRWITADRCIRGRVRRRDNAGERECRQ